MTSYAGLTETDKPIKIQRTFPFQCFHGTSVLCVSVVYVLYVCTCMSTYKKGQKNKSETEEEWEDVMCLCVGEGWSYAWWAKPNPG